MIYWYKSTKTDAEGGAAPAAPMSFLIEQAGGLSLTGKTRIMDLKPKGVHQRVPFLAGSADDVMEMKSYYDACNDPEIIKRCLERAS